MGAVESNDKEVDSRIPEHMTQNFRQSQYLQSNLPTSSSDDDRYGLCQFLESAYDRQILKKRIRVKDDRQFSTFLKNKQQRMNFDSSLFVKLLDYDCGAIPYEESDNGTYKYYIDCYFEHHPNDLKYAIADRKSNDQRFSAQELKQIMNMLISAGTTLDNIGSRHGDIRPEFIVLDGEGKPLLMDNVRDKAGTGGRLALATEIDVYLSPLLFKCYSRNVVKYKHDKAKDDVFSAGMVLLEAGILESVQGCYDKETGKFKLDNLNELLEKFEQIYSSDNDLCQKLRRFLVSDEADRCRFKELAAQGGYVQPAMQAQSTGYGYQQPSNQYAGGYNSGYGQTAPQKPSYTIPSYGQSYPASPQYGQTYGSPQQSYHPQPAQTVNSYSSGYNSGYGSPQPQTVTRSPGANPLASRLGQNY